MADNKTPELKPELLAQAGVLGDVLRFGADKATNAVTIESGKRTPEIAKIELQLIKIGALKNQPNGSLRLGEMQKAKEFFDNDPELRGKAFLNDTVRPHFLRINEEGLKILDQRTGVAPQQAPAPQAPTPGSQAPAAPAAAAPAAAPTPAAQEESGFGSLWNKAKAAGSAVGSAASSAADKAAQALKDANVCYTEPKTGTPEAEKYSSPDCVDARKQQNRTPTY
ncbi:MAG: hypothetical protein ACOYNL_03560 [Rickettsiales bacterium]